MKRLIFAFASAVMWTAGATPVTGNQAKLAVGNWLADEAAPMSVRFTRPSSETETVSDENGRALFHVVRMEGGGYAATPTDTRINPIVVFSGSGEIDLSEASPLRKILEADMARRLEAVSRRGTAKGADGISKAEKAWANLLAHRGGRPRSVADEGQLSDVRVPPLVKTKWDQKTWDDTRAGSPAVYSRYTPYGWVCGCVATAGAQIMKYYNWPTKEMSADWFVVQTNGQYFVRRRTAGCYAWSEMPLSCAVCADISESECDAIGKLTSDVGLAVNMNYKRFFDPEHNRWVEDSSAHTANLTVALTTEFDYASGKVYWPEVVNGSILTGTLLGEQMEGAILASIDAGMPVSAAIHGDEGGHSVVIDGYGYKNGIRYMHINMGWSGAEDIWYDVMGEKLSATYQFDRLKAVGYNIHPTETGDIISGRVLSASGEPVANADVSVTLDGNKYVTVKSNEKGIYYFRVKKNGTYFIEAKEGSRASKQAVQEVVIGSSAALLFETGTVDDGTVVKFFAGRVESEGTVGNKWGVDLTLEKEEDVVVVREVVADPVITPETTEFTNTAIQVKITCSTEGAKIRYTKNGTDPTASSTEYTEPLTVNATTTIKAKAFKENADPSAVVTRTYKKISYNENPEWKAALDSTLDFFTYNEAAYDAKYLKAQNLIAHDGNSALRMQVGCDETAFIPSMSKIDTAINTTVSGSGLLTFWWRIGEDIGGISMSFDKFELWVDDEHVASAPTGWWEKEYVVLGEGSHTITWKISASVVSPNWPCGFLDEVDFQMGAPENFLVPVTFDLNGGDAGSHPLPIVERCYPNESVEMSAFVGTREGYKFIEWNTKADGTGFSYSTSDKYLVRDMEPVTFYAIWKKILPVLVEFPYEGGISKLPLSAYGHSITIYGGVPPWINGGKWSQMAYNPTGSFVVRGTGLNVEVGSSARVSLGNLLPDDAYAEFDCEKNDNYEPRTCDLYMDAIDYPFVINFKITQRGDNQTHKLADVVLKAENDAVASSATKLVCNSIYRDSAVGSPDADRVRWSVVSGGEYASVSSDGKLSANPVASAQTVRVRATYAEDGIECEALKDVRIVPSVDLSAALNVAGMPFTLSGEGDWVGQTDVTLDGDGAARAASCASGDRWMETKVSVAESDSLEFDCRMSVCSGTRLILVDNGEETVCAGSSVNGANWIHVRHDLTPGEHVLRFVYSSERGIAGVGNLDNAWIDRLAFGPHTTAVGAGPKEPEHSGLPAIDVEELVPSRGTIGSAGPFAAPAARTYTGVMLADGTATATLQVKVGKASRKGESRVTVSVIGLDGKKHTAKAQKVKVGGTPKASFEVKGLGTLTLTFDAAGFVGKLNGNDVISYESVARTDAGSATFTATNLKPLAGVLKEYLPTNETVTCTAKKWKVAAKAGRLKYVKPNAKRNIAGGLQATGVNIAGLKLSYSPKNQTFSGSFKIWTFDETKKKLKAVSAKVTGIVVNGTGCGQVTVSTKVNGVKVGKVGNLTVK